MSNIKCRTVLEVVRDDSYADHYGVGGYPIEVTYNTEEGSTNKIIGTISLIGSHGISLTVGTSKIVIPVDSITSIGIHCEEDNDEEA